MKLVSLRPLLKTSEKSVAFLLLFGFYVTSANSQLILNKGTRQSWIIEPQLNWGHKWSTVEIAVLAGGTLQNQKQEALAIDGYGFSSNSVINSLTAAKTITVLTNDISEYPLRSSLRMGSLPSNYFNVVAFYFKAKIEP